MSLSDPALPGWARCAAAGLLVLALPAAAASGTTPRADRPDPLDSQAPVPALDHRSPLEGYRRLGEDIRVPWRAANETVNRIGGWRAYAREAEPPQAAPLPAAPAAAPVPPAPARPSHPHHPGAPR